MLGATKFRCGGAVFQAVSPDFLIEVLFFKFEWKRFAQLQCLILRVHLQKAHRFSNDKHLVVYFSGLISEKSFNSKLNKFDTDEQNKCIRSFLAIDTTFPNLY